MKIVKNAFSQLSSKFLTKCLGFFTFTWTVHYLGVNGYGRYSYITTFVSFFAMFSDMGMNANLFKDVSKQPSKAAEQLGLTLGVEALVLPVLLLLLSGIAWTLEPDRVLWLFIVFAAFGTLSRVFSQSVIQVLNGLEHFHLTAALDIVESAINLGLIGAVVLGDLKIKGLLLSLIVKHVAMLLISLVCYFRLKGSIRWNWNHKALTNLIWLSFPFVVIGLLNNVYQQMDIIMLKHMTNFDVVGAYGAAYRLLTFVFLLGATLSGVIFPRLAQKSNQVDAESYRFYGLSGRMLAYLALGINILCVVAGQRGIEMILGHDFDYGGKIFVVLSLSIVINFLALIPTYTLMATEKLWRYAGVYVVSVLVNVAINFLAIPRWSGLGAAWATNVTELVTLYFIYDLVRRSLKTPHLFDVAQLLRFLLVSGIGIGAAFYARSWPIFISLPVFALLYILLLRAGRVLSDDDQAWVTEFFGRLRQKYIR